MEMRGTILLRNTTDDTVWVLQTDRLEQVGAVKDIAGLAWRLASSFMLGTQKQKAALLGTHMCSWACRGPS